MTSKEIREKFLEFFKEKGHTIIPSASLIPKETDPTVLFTTAGMHPLVPYLLGENHPGGRRVANAQKCIRTGDIDEIGDESHLTFFEMLGNWSFGDYFKKETIEWSFEFLTGKKWLGIAPERISATVFAGDQDAPRDEESAKIWESLGIPKERIFYKGKEDNWWGPAGATGPCGPDTEMFINGTEIWNDVFMEFNKNADGKYESLRQKNVDTGMGLERIAMVMQGKDNVYETDLFEPIVQTIKSQIPRNKLQTNSNFQNSNLQKSIRIVADHIKASVFMIADGVEPSNAGRGYVLRRLLRRALRHGRLLNVESREWIADIAKIIIDIYGETYPEVGKNKEKIFRELEGEEANFIKTLDRGLKEFNNLSHISGKDAFDLYQTYGFPFEMTKELAEEKGLKIDEEEFEKEFEKHQELSRTASAGMFKGGLADAGEMTTRYHTATHLLLSALRQVLGNHVEQRGSNITAERMRFDFSHSQKMTAEEIKRTEDIVNDKIKENLPVVCEEMDFENAKKAGAIGVFEEKYGDIVKVYSIGASTISGTAFSREICGGPHADSTGELGHLTIIKEEAISAGARRIKAILGL